MTLGPEFRHADITKAQRRVRTLAGVRFFKQPIGTPITPDMVNAAKAEHGAKKVDAMLVLQRRNTARDNRRGFFANQADVRHQKRETRLENNAMRRAGKKADTADRKAESAPKAALVTRPVTKPTTAPPKAATTTAPKAAAPAPLKAQARVLTDTMRDAGLDLLHHPKRWSEKQFEAVMALINQGRATPNAEERALIIALRERVKKEDR